MLGQVGAHNFRDEELARLIGTTWWLVPVGAVIGVGFLSAANLMFACSRANFFLSVPDDPQSWVSRAGAPEIEAGWLFSLWHDASCCVLSVADASHIATMSRSRT
jgi:hypothetical protein